MERSGRGRPGVARRPGRYLDTIADAVDAGATPGTGVPATPPTTDARGSTDPAVEIVMEVGAGHVGAAGSDDTVDDAVDEAREAALVMFRHREGLDPDAVILAPPFPVTPVLRMPPHAWALEVDDVDLFAAPGDPDVAPEVAVFVGHWGRNPDPTGAHPTGVVVRLKPTSGDTDPLRHHDADPDEALAGGRRVDVTALRVVQGVWRQVGRWPAAGADWPRVVAPTIATVLDDQAELRSWRARAAAAQRAADCAARNAESAGREAIRRLAMLRGPGPRRAAHGAAGPATLRMARAAAGRDERIRLTARGRDRLWRATRASELAANGLLDSVTAPLPEGAGLVTGTDR